MVPARRNRLRHEARLVEVVGRLALGDLARSEAIAVGRERLDHRLGLVGAGEPGVGVEVVFDVGDLVVQTTRDEEVDAVTEVFDEADCVDDSGGCGDQVQRCDARRYETSLRKGLEG